MKTVTKFGFLAAAVIGIALVAPAAHATCGVDVSFGNYPTVGSCGGGSCYVKSPGAATIASLNKSIFWVLGVGNPTVGSGIDNGGYLPDGTNGNKPWLAGPFGGGYQIASGWAQGVTDGCADNPATMTMAAGMFDTSADGINAYAAFSTATLDFTRGSQWDFGSGSQHIQLVQIPCPTVTGTTRDAVDNTKINVTVTWPNTLPATAFSANGSGKSLTDVVTGWEVYVKETAGTTAPAVRDTAQWTSKSVVAGAGSATASFQFQCTTPSNNAFLALGLDLNSGFKSPFVGCANAVRIACAGNLATPNPKGKVTKIDRKNTSN